MWCSFYPSDRMAARSSILVAETITEPSTIYSRIPQLNATSPPSEPAVNPGPDLPPVSAVGSVTCCPPHCKGQVCSNSRSLIRKLVTDLSLFVDRLKDLTRTEQRGSYRVSGLTEAYTCYSSNVSICQSHDNADMMQ